MKSYFLDTSALVKIYHSEVGSEYCLARYEDNSHLVISELARVELYSAILRKKQNGELSTKALTAVSQRFDCDCEERFEVLHVASLVYDEACRLLSTYAESHGLRTLDSIQLATYLTYCEKDRDVFVSADRKLSRVAEYEGAQAVFV